MKVRELVEHLRKLAPELDILCYCEDKKLLTENRGFILFDIIAVNKSEAEGYRLEDDTPYLKFGRGLNSVAMATIEVTSDF